MLVNVGGQVGEAAPSLEVAAPSAGVFTRRNLVIAAALFGGAFACFAALAHLCHLPLRAGSPYNYFADQAAAWLHLHWYLDHPGSTIDLIRMQGHYYSIYGPFPALLMLPLVALFGGVNDALFTMVFSALNLSLLFLLFEQLRATGLSSRGWRENAAWSVFLYVGSTALFLSLTGFVWYTGHIVSCTCLLVSLLLAFRRSFVWSAVALGGAFFTRSIPLLGFPFLLYLAWQDGVGGHAFEAFVGSLWARRPAWQTVPWRRLGGVLAVIGGCLALYFLRNWSMFGNPLESGYNIQRAQRYAFVTHGVFSPYYIPANLINDFFNFPHIVFSTHYTAAPTIDLQNGSTGICLFLTTPLFLLLFLRNRERSWLRVALWATIALMTVVVLTFYTAGYPQFGTRYLFDIFPYAWVLLAISDVRMSWRVALLGVFGVVINVLGTYQHWSGLPYFHLPFV